MKKVTRYATGFIAGMIDTYGTTDTRDAVLARVQYDGTTANGFDAGVEVTPRKLFSLGILTGAILVASFLSGCATAPDKIKAAPMRVGCSADRADDVVALATLSDKQEQARKDDIAATIFLGVPIAKMTGHDYGKEIARLKGCLAG